MKTIFLICLTTILSIQIGFSQTNTQKVLVAKYSLYPYSTEFFNHNTDKPNEAQSFDIALRRTKEFKYTFLSDFKTDRAVFFLDSIITKPIKGKESFWIEPELVSYFSYKNNTTYCKKISIFKHVFYASNTADFSFEWDISKERKIIAGFNCIKAVSNVRNNKIIAWFTTEIPINYSPLGLYGLPGLVLQAETFFNTITIENIKYLTTDDLLNVKMDEYEEIYNKEKKDDEIKESILLLKKAQLVSQLKMMR